MASCRFLGRAFMEARFALFTINQNHAYKVLALVDNSMCKQYSVGRNLFVGINGRSLVRSFASGSLDSEFKDASSRVTTLKNEPDNNTKLELYALFKQGSVGPCNTKKPGIMDFVGQAKWKSWNALGALSQEEAKKKYIELVNKLAAASK